MGPDSPASSDLSEPPSPSYSVDEDQLSSAVPSSRPSVDITNADHEQLAPPTKRRRTGPSSLAILDCADSSQLGDDTNNDDTISVSSDGWSSAPGSPSHGEYAMRDEAQTECLWKDCTFGNAIHNDELVRHVQATHCATGGPKKTKYICEWGECQRKTSNHPSGYALKAHMRSHTKEKPYYCALPECDKSFTRSDALAKHMRTVHEPEQPKIGTNEAATPLGKKGSKLRLANGTLASKAPDSSLLKPIYDEDGDEVSPSPANDNITYLPAHHPITGQPGFMIHYPPDIDFTAYESSVPADYLMKMLRRQVHYAEQESAELQQEIDDLERMRKEEWLIKEILLEGVMETELAHAERENILLDVDESVKDAMERDVRHSKTLAWVGKKPVKRRAKTIRPNNSNEMDQTVDDIEDTFMEDVDDQSQRTPSPPPTGRSGGFDGDDDPYDNFLAGQMAMYEQKQKERDRLRESSHNTPVREISPADQHKAESDAIGALVGMGAIQAE
ncbi:INO80 complex subunit 1 [Acrodontium crateriforme]|uniref:INO80 complex subunit 1 n=1 Tax=Acrodontium crateriforme TaxID=150365 RepID=A0AAQ3M0H7_9PEZI|nr:INO80 complex subunit 1 [Acrodontium crateriforme]